MAEKATFSNMVLIPGSAFSMGSAGGSRLTSPEKRVMVEAFYMDIYPVTNDAYNKVIASRKINPAERNHPVTGLTYDQIMKYCRLVGKRLPSEAEWEKAARGDRDQRPYPWGDSFDRKKCNCRGLLFLKKRPITPVDAFNGSKSPYGCIDMMGNVWEWTGTRIDEEGCILKGGSCTSPSKKYLTIPSRLVVNKTDINLNYGFRCCVSVKD